MSNTPARGPSPAAAGQPSAHRYRCATMDRHWQLIRKDPEYRWRVAQVERETQEWIARFAGAGLRTGLVRIPVVVHVLYANAAQNISDAQIQSQIEILNRDYRRLNVDAASTPAVFAAVAADARLEFALATRAPDCTATTGITRTHTATTGWTRGNDAMKSSATGGVEPWDVTKYLNFWIVNYTDGTLGYGTFPAMPAAIQGCVCDYRAFGDVGAAAGNAPYNLGRTMTHEVGHYFNLRHIWGDDGGACSGSDEVDDTPNQGDLHFGAPSFPQISCSNGPNGDMFMNYMDYTDDGAMNMFTVGQAARMDAALNTARASLIASDGLVAPGGVPGPDLWMQDVSDDTGAEPDPSAQPMWVSNDIYVRRTNDGLLNVDHENPVYRPPGSPTNFVYVRVRNRACSGTASGMLRLYWAKASTGLAWPSPWDGGVTVPALMGSPIGSQPVSVAGGDDEIFVFPWSPPNPEDYAAFGADRAHFCLLARIETEAAAPFGMTVPETSNLYQNVQNNNNIVWKNVTVAEEGDGRIGQVLISNFGKRAGEAWLMFFERQGRERATSMLAWGRVYVSLTEGAAKAVAEMGPQKTGLRRLDDEVFLLERTGVRFGPLKLAPGRHEVATLRFEQRVKTTDARVLTLHLAQFDQEKIVGGQQFAVRTHAAGRRPKEGLSPFDGISWSGGGGHGCSCCS